MVSSKHITKIALALMALALAFCVLAMWMPGEILSVGGRVYSMEYETKLFNTDSVLDIDIQMDQATWQEMLDNARQETYYTCDVTVAGKTFYQVGVRPKGNTSLSSVASDPNNNRYSFKLEFDQFVDGQTCFGLDKLTLNNNYADATAMKEAVIYDMFRYMGVDSPLYNYAKISVNGEYWGVYLALEAVEESFLLRTVGTDNAHLYKPDSMNMGGKERGEQGAPGGDMPQFNEDMRKQMEEMRKNRDNQASAGQNRAQNREQGGFNPANMGDFGGFGGFNRGGGANLNYIDDNVDSYSTIWNGAVTDSSVADHERVVTALKNISSGTNLERYMDVDNLLRYMAVHVFSENSDSLSGGMAHNYYLQETLGQLNIIPWDYNLAFGGMGMGGFGGGGSGATSMVNAAIDDSFQSTKFFDHFLTDETYLKAYHDYMNVLVSEYVMGGGFEATYNRIRSQIDELVKEDPNAQYSYEAYEKAAEVLYETVLLRAESIKGQLSGTIPSTTEGQRAAESALVDASHINLSDMGTFMGGGRGPGERKE